MKRKEEKRSLLIPPTSRPLDDLQWPDIEAHNHPHDLELMASQRGVYFALAALLLCVLIYFLPSPSDLSLEDLSPYVQIPFGALKMKLTQLDHFMFATIHGYDYKIFKAPSPQGLHGTWSKVSAIRQALQDYEIVVFLDADAIIRYPHLPFEWLFNYWGINENTRVAMALDPDEPQNKDSQGVTYLNTGFVVAQQSLETNELFDAWESCPSEVRYPNCSWWAEEWPHEQAAFGEYLRYDFEPDDVKVLPCAEANGYPELENSTCHGEFIRHYWTAKHLVPAAVDYSIAQYSIREAHSIFHQDLEKLLVNMTGPVSPHY
ncbi:hypothetical protein N7468_009603 [Penicillium chermesinum]|uniref:Nucleotide-diphospho-sugar transferase domain-containing protein n=1 Tax=Penicillium chermesinum TaxID=63820 RepID=A0A9W9TFE5_9EURO|nr:uncharacterized protein N7468_009603 [Penicillium chermesinum]KAJ5220399.1 hypothetical protein N7468_009603 [Penicillium chermesinum]